MMQRRYVAPINYPQKTCTFTPTDKATMDITTARTLLDEAKRLLAEAEAAVTEAEANELPKAPPFSSTEPRVVTFQKRFGRSYGKFYTYAAMSPGQLNSWYLTGRGCTGESLLGMPWDKLMEFMVKDETPESRAKVIATFKVWS